MAVIRDMMPAFELFQPATIDEAVALLDRHGSSAWVMAGRLLPLDASKPSVNSRAARTAASIRSLVADKPGNILALENELMKERHG